MILKPEPKAPVVNKLVEVGFVESPVLTERAKSKEAELQLLHQL